MPVTRETVWLRRDPLGSHTKLPTRDDFRSRHARHSITCAAIGGTALVLLVGLRVSSRWEGSWNPLLALAFFFAMTGVGAGAIALRTRRLRIQALAGLGVSLATLVGALFVESLVDLAGG
jgi:hypothetical protein